MMQVEELGHLVLYVSDVERSAAFYGDLLGWKPVFGPAPGMPVAAFSSGRTHHELLLIEVGEGAAAPTRRAGASGSTTSASRSATATTSLREVVARLKDAGRDHRRGERPHGHPQPLRARSRRQRGRALHRRARGRLAVGSCTGAWRPIRPLAL